MFPLPFGAMDFIYIYNTYTTSSSADKHVIEIEVYWLHIMVHLALQCQN